VARPREFDEEQVLDRALDVFWAKGFDGTSIQDLVEATGLGRASLYGAFGEKDKLYALVLERYLARVDTPAVNIDPSLHVRDALEELFTAWLGARCSKVSPRGCFLSLAATESEDARPGVREAMAASLKRREKIILGLVRRGQERGEIARERDATAMARLLVVVLQGIATSGRAGWGSERLHEAVTEALDLVAPRAAKTKARARR
jgi:TetR/AcrR family transcriptional regulator, transcriptional repressor for nem operon